MNRIALFVLLLLSLSATAQNPTYLLKITNESQPTSNTYEFDIYLLRTGTVELELTNFQCGIGIDTNVMNGGTLTVSIIPGSSELLPAQVPVGFSMGTTLWPSTTANCGSCNGTGIIYKYMNVFARANPGHGQGTIISYVDSGCVEPGTRIGRFRLTNTVNFKANTSPHLVHAASSGTGKTRSAVSAYVPPLFNPTPITVIANNLNWNSPGTCINNSPLYDGCALQPTASAGGPYSSCSAIQLNGAIGGGATMATWSSPSGGTFTPSATTLNAVYNPSPSDFGSGSVQLTLTTNNPAGCSTAVSTALVNIISCDDGNPCTIDYCDSNRVCQHDTVTPMTFYSDNDNDGFGNPFDSVVSCVQSPGYSVYNNDCNDNNALINPAATEKCNNYIDDNCDGEINETCPGATLHLKVFVEGFYTSSQSQRPALLNSGISSDPELTDIVTVALHDTVSPYTALITRTGILFTNGSAYIDFPSSIIGQTYFISFRQRNTVETWSKVPVTFSHFTTYNFFNP